LDVENDNLFFTGSLAGFNKKSGGKHDIWLKAGFPPIPVPRHKGDIPKGTLKNIIKYAKLEDIK